ncbi:hypothetical protein FB451DRAFT_1362711 [Mycena latifolia]|nr:hypothetical protein FB451DRAFT_1362711 [Mycena latifolia]
MGNVGRRGAATEEAGAATGGSGCGTKARDGKEGDSAGDSAPGGEGTGRRRSRRREEEKRKRNCTVSNSSAELLATICRFSKFMLPAMLPSRRTASSARCTTSSVTRLALERRRKSGVVVEVGGARGARGAGKESGERGEREARGRRRVAVAARVADDRHCDVRVGRVRGEYDESDSSAVKPSTRKTDPGYALCYPRPLPDYTWSKSKAAKHRRINQLRDPRTDRFRRLSQALIRFYQIQCVLPVLKLSNVRDEAVCKPSAELELEASAIPGRGR